MRLGLGQFFKHSNKVWYNVFMIFTATKYWRIGQDVSNGQISVLNGHQCDPSVTIKYLKSNYVLLSSLDLFILRLDLFIYSFETFFLPVYLLSTFSQCYVFFHKVDREILNKMPTCSFIRYFLVCSLIVPYQNSTMFFC